MWAPMRNLRIPLTGARAVMLAVLLALVAGLFGVAPVRSQSLTLQAGHTSAEVPLDDAWAAVWDTAPLQNVALSAQNVAPPFGGGTVQAVTAKALFDDQRLYVMVEWADDEPDDTVNGVEAFSDAVALEFPGTVDTSTPYTMGGPGTPVNIWQWKALWQADIDSGYTTSADRYPDTVSDFYPNADDPDYNPARAVGNPLAQDVRSSPVENLIAEGFGTLTTAEIQNVDGSGAWRDGKWRAVFSRALAATGAGMTNFDTGGTTLVAFAVWDGAEGERNGQKSIAQFIELGFGATATPVAQPPQGGGAQSTPVWIPTLVLLGIFLVLAALGSVALYFRRAD